MFLQTRNQQPHTCSPRDSHFLSSRLFCTRLKNMSLRLFVAASRVCITGLGLKVRCGAAVCSLMGDDMVKSKIRGCTFPERSDNGDDRGGVYGE